MGMTKEFKEFILKGNIMELAVAVIIGAAFSAIVSSFVDDIVTPLLLAPALKAAHVENLNQLVWGTVKYGNFLAAIIKFLIVAFVLFMVIRSLNAMNRKKEDVPAAPPAPSSTETLLAEIRDELKRR